MSALAWHGVRTRRDRVSLRVHGRTAVVSVALLLAVLAVGVVSVGTGDYPLSPAEVVATLAGRGDPASAFIVETLRLPRVLTALLVGGAFGIAGAMFQSISRNPLGSPDVIGRIVVRPGELEVGIVTALVGAPVFIALVRRTRIAQL